MVAGVDRAVDGDRRRRGEPAVAVDHVDLAARQRGLQPLPEPLDDALLVGEDRGHLDALERGPHPELRALPRGVGDLGRVQQRLGRDAAAVQAGPAYLVLLDQGHALAKLGRAQRAGVPAAAAAEDDDVVMAALCHSKPLFRLRSVSHHVTAVLAYSTGKSPGGRLRRDRDECPHRRARAALGRVAERGLLVEGRAGDVEVRPGDPVRHELLQEQPADHHAALAVRRDVGQVGDGGVQPLAQLLGERHRPGGLARRRA